MKNINIFRVITVVLLALSAQQVHCARPGVVAKQAAVAISTNTGVGQDLALATTFAESELIVKKATEVMDKARESLLSKSTTQVEDTQNVKTIIDQNYAIVMAKQKLEKMRDELAQKIEKDVAPEGYWGKFVAGAKNVGSGIASLFAAGTGTEEEKETARQVIKGLTEQEVKVTEKYALLQKDLTSAEQAQLKSRYEAIVEQFEAAIYAQQLITGDMRSSMIKRSLLLGAAAAGTVAAGVMLKDKYFGAEAEITEGEAIETGIEQQEKPRVITMETAPTLQDQADKLYNDLQQAKKMQDAYIKNTPDADPEAIKAYDDAVMRLTLDYTKVAEKLSSTETQEILIQETLIPETPVRSMEDIEATMRQRAKEESTPYKVGRWIKEAPGKAYEAAKGGVKRVSEAFQKRGETPENPEEEGITELGTELTTTIPSKIEQGKQAIEKMGQRVFSTSKPTTIGKGITTLREMPGKVSDYFTRPGEPAQKPEDVEGITLEDLEPLTQSELGQAAAKKAGQVSDYFTSPGQPAQNPEDVEGITLEDLEPLTQSELGQAVTKKYEEAKGFANQKGKEWAQKKAEGLAAEQAEIEQRQSEEASLEDLEPAKAE